MMGYLGNEMALLFTGQFLPFLSVMAAIILTMVFRIFRLSVVVNVLIANCFLLLGWICCFFENAQWSQRPDGFFLDNISDAGIKFIVPAVIVVNILLLIKPALGDRKADALLLILISSFGAMLTSVSHNWILFFIGLQCLSLPLYGLLIFNANDQEAVSAGARYLVLSFLAMGFLLFGILLIYSSTGTMDFYAQAEKIATMSAFGLPTMGFAFIMVGLGFKASLFPFHVWAPDVYQRASNFLIAFMMVVIKPSIVFFLLRCFFIIFRDDSRGLLFIVAIMAIASMWIGNILMVMEKNFIRFLAYLSISHLGYLMIPILAHSTLGIEAIFLDLAAFSVAIVIAIAHLRESGSSSSSLSIENFRGLAQHDPIKATSFIVALVSVAGFPLTAGFIGKYAIFTAAIEAGLWQPLLHMVLSSLVGLFALARVIALIFSKGEQTEYLRTRARGQRGALLTTAFLLLLFGLFPNYWIATIKDQTDNFLVQAKAGNVP